MHGLVTGIFSKAPQRSLLCIEVETTGRVWRTELCNYFQWNHVRMLMFIFVWGPLFSRDLQVPVLLVGLLVEHLSQVLVAANVHGCSTKELQVVNPHVFLQLALK